MLRTKASIEKGVVNRLAISLCHHTKVFIGFRYVDPMANAPVLLHFTAQRLIKG